MKLLDVERFVREDRTNATRGWTVRVGLLFVTGANLLVGRPMGALFTAGATILAAIPAIAGRSWDRMFPWAFLLVAAIPFATRPLAIEHPMATTGSISVAVFAFVLALDLELLTAVRMTTGFAAVFVAVASIGIAGFWAVARWVAHGAVGSRFVTSNEALMWEFLGVAGTAVFVASLFAWYLRRFSTGIESDREGEGW